LVVRRDDRDITDADALEQAGEHSISPIHCAGRCVEKRAMGIEPT
jgi:hypothetical protein